MENRKIFNIENGKEEFAEFIKVKSVYNEKLRDIVASLRKVEMEIEKLDGKIAQTINELATSIFMKRSVKEKKYAYIEKLKSDKASGLETIEALRKHIKELKKETFDATKTPRINFGRYPKEADGSEAPIEWDVIRIKADSALLLSTYVIDQIPYAKKLEDTPWKNSYLRKWLNEDFYNKCFSEEERQMIIQTENANPGNEAYNTAASVNTRDNIFVFSINDMRRYYDYDPDRLARATDYAKSRGVYSDEKTLGAYWWLRSNGGNMYNAAVVNFTGYVFDYGFYVNSGELGVRPALWIALK